MQPHQLDTDRAVILFDGVCNFCNKWVNLVIRHDPHGEFHFASLQSETGQSLLSANGLQSADLDSIVLIDKDGCFTHSTAVLRICRKLDGWWKFLYFFIIVPRPLRNIVYRWVAKHRYQFFGKQDSCMIPTKEIRSRFLDLSP
ncbi:thiol-disulfide oxidoreductase DCC family protein [Paenactinomyces guangxiensis]|uniref:Thiol-disulfide oxidoreductase DCC family protein n=1 Tax=Paenactinomyces guangxiensis TaxID=1490290 RepID=A0A7W1WSL8_9BACL|nr:thiol-disulfide oxidoreductase DCC family protein [Paenactinomyces guangxiensis]MBA4495277.1 thiol-disulfide oxidoreductase DCC family protein [Paenactinomyces guangxiensis]MBH8592361.1 thiol-disulfide oxidoreductase DCC family protein [Paenactinomyces guangxiensis]